MPRILTFGLPMAQRAGDLMALGFDRSSYSSWVSPSDIPFSVGWLEIRLDLPIGGFHPPLEVPLGKPDEGLPPGIETNDPRIEDPFLSVSMDEKGGKGLHQSGGDLLHVDNVPSHLCK